jgi:aspartate 1-decarboxylase
MQIEMLINKIRYATVTDSNPLYKGSITLDPVFIEAAGMFPWQAVYINGRDKDVRIKTYILEGTHGSGQVELNGGAAQYFSKGDVIHINAYGMVDIDIASIFTPTILESTR